MLSVKEGERDLKERKGEGKSRKKYPFFLDNSHWFLSMYVLSSFSSISVFVSNLVFSS